MEDTPMSLLVAYALTMAGTQYRWGGDDPMHGFDCSGFVMELLKSVGLFPHNSDMSCQQIYDTITRRDISAEITTGSLAFYGKALSAISHVGFCLDGGHIIEAGGGDSTTTTGEAAAAQNAFIRIRPLRYRKDLLIVIRPKYPWEDDFNGNQ